MRPLAVAEGVEARVARWAAKQRAMDTRNMLARSPAPFIEEPDCCPRCGTMGGHATSDECITALNLALVSHSPRREHT